MDYIQSFVDQRIGYLSLDRPNKHNAFNAQFMAEIKQAFTNLASNDDVRVIVLRSTGKNFCAGADLDYMRSMSDYTKQQNIDDAGLLFDLFNTIYHYPKPTIALVSGWALGGGIGLVTCCDFAIAASNSEFCFSETKLGLVPATIAPFVMRKIGSDIAKRLFITAQRFNAEAALDINLISELVTLNDLEARGKQLANQIIHNGPNAIIASKHLLQALDPIHDDIKQMTSACIAQVRTSSEGQEGLSAFFEKRQPNWTESE